jgi:hypothetical protein
MRWILLNNGRPFADRQDAVQKGNRVSVQLGPTVTVEVIWHPGGYALLCSRPGEEEPLASVPLDGERAQAGHEWPGPARASASPYPERMDVRASPRAFLGTQLLVLLGVYFTLWPFDLPALLHIALPNHPLLREMVRAWVVGGAAVCALVGTGRILIAWAFTRYRIDAAGIEETEWYFDRGRLRPCVRRVSFVALRTVELKQTLGELLLSVGTLCVTADCRFEPPPQEGGPLSLPRHTEEIKLRQVRSPRALQAELQRRARLASAPPPSLARSIPATAQAGGDERQPESLLPSRVSHPT